MKKKILSLAVFLCLAIISFIPINQKKEFGITANFDNTLLQVVNVDNWKNWYPKINEGFNKNPDDYHLLKDTAKKTDTIFIADKKYIIRALAPLAYQVSEDGKLWKQVFAFSVFPTDTMGKMKISLLQKTPLLFNLLGMDKDGQSAIEGLKSYLEDPKQFYGFDIEKDTIRNPIIATALFRVLKKDMFIKIDDASKNLNEYITENKLQKAGNISIAFMPLTIDSIQVSVGIPVNKTAPNANGIRCLALPVRGKILVGKYEGDFEGRQKIYNAMSKYMIDHHFSAPADPFERYLNDSIPRNDSSRIKIELNFPIF